ncbi:FusB/FusC family EF-G-binding protein [Paenibacillus glufosinatiresistens]|uniref:FusB/FusC family EF-G-binding protein n=1 Tax=Paenibacillus glufosinatiresistens TaxID=3070657 RepID=UPI00286DE5C5|nr:FusB/FusC family EF-G-binding protein [Paenibacillus sp. YX.27]
MSMTFIRNHQMNVIQKQADFVLKTLRSVADRGVIETVRHSAAASIFEQFPDLTEERREMLGRLTSLQTAEEFQEYLSGLEPYREPMPPITTKQLQKLFPKHKKLKLPDLEAVDFRELTYLSWTDIATNRLFIVYPLEEQYIGMEGRLTPVNKKGYCVFCNRNHELAFFSVHTRAVHASPDHFSIFGHYICLDNKECNRSITGTEALEKFIRTVRR